MSRRLPGSAIVPGSITLTQIAGSLNDTTNAAYAQANSARDQANTARSDANTTFATINTTFATLNTSAGTQNTNIGLAYDQANSARGQANTGYAQANSARDQANTARTTANDAYATANSRLPSVGGTVSGDLIITGNLTVSGNQTILNTEVLTTEDADIILLSNTAGTPALNAGLIVNRGTSTNTFLRWAENVDEWGWSDNGTVTYFFDDLRQGLITTNTTFGTINTNITNTNSNAVNAYASANLAYTQANTARSDANTTFATVNTTFATINTTTATMNTATSNRVLKAGDTMTGQLNISSGGLLVTGNVGIGDATVPYRLDVNGDIGIRGTNYLYMGHSSAGTNWAARLRNSGGQFQVDAGSFRIADVGYTGTITWLAGDTSGRVGIGTASPIARLTIAGNLGASVGNGNSAIRLINTDSGNYASISAGIVGVTNEGMDFSTDGTRRMVISGGNVAIGTTTATQRLTVNGGIESLVDRAGGALEGGQIILRAPAGGNTRWNMDNFDNKFRIFREDDSDSANGAVNIWAVNGGNVGIGTSSPGSTLDIFGLQTNSSASSASNPTGTLRLSFAGAPGINEYGASLVFSQYWWTGSTSHIGVGQITGVKTNANGTFGGGLAFWTSNGTNNNLTERMRIDSAGNVGIGTSSPSGVLQIDHNVAQGAAVLILNRNDANTSPNGTILWRSQGTNRAAIGCNYNIGDAAGNLEFLAGGMNTRMVVGSGGNVGINTTTPFSKLSITGSLSKRRGDIDLALNTHSAYFGLVESGYIEFTIGYSGTVQAGRVCTFTYEATDWKSWWCEIDIASTGGYGVWRLGGYNNNSSGHNVYESHDNNGIATVTYNNSGQFNVITITLNTQHIHPGFRFKYHQTGGDGPPRMDRAKIVWS